MNSELQKKLESLKAKAAEMERLAEMCGIHEWKIHESQIKPGVVPGSFVCRKCGTRRATFEEANKEGWYVRE